MELISRVKALLRRTLDLKEETRIVYRNIVIDNDKHAVFVDETPFYATMGGQSGDIGVIRIGDSAEFTRL